MGRFGFHVGRGLPLVTLCLSACASFGGGVSIRPVRRILPHPLVLPRGSVARLSPDGRHVAVKDHNGPVHLVDTCSARTVRTFEGAGPHGWSLDFSPDGRLLAVSDGTLQVRLWSLDASKEAGMLEASATVRRVRFSPDGKLLLVATTDARIQLWDPARGCVVREFREHRRYVDAVAFTPEGGRVLSGDMDGVVLLWEVATGRVLARILEGSINIDALDVSPDGAYAAIAAHSPKLRIVELPSGRTLAEPKGHSDRINSVAYSPDGKRLLTGSDDGTWRLWDASGIRERRREKGAHVSAVQWGPDGRKVLVVDGNGPRLWDLESDVLISLEALEYLMALSVDSWRGLSMGNEGLVLWDLETGRTLAERPVDQAHDFFALSADGERVLLYEFPHLKLVELKTGKEVLGLRVDDGFVLAGALSPSGDRIVYSSSRARVRVLDRGGKPLREWDLSVGVVDELTDHGVPNVLAFSPDGKFVGMVRRCSPDRIQIFEIDSGSEVKELSVGQRVRALAILTGNRILYSTEDKKLTLFDFAKERALHDYEGHRWVINLIGSTADGESFLTVSRPADCTTPTEVLLWRR